MSENNIHLLSSNSLGFNEVPIKIPMLLLMETEPTILKSLWKHRRP
jgi:hypothetical protein